MRLLLILLLSCVTGWSATSPGMGFFPSGGTVSTNEPPVGTDGLLNGLVAYYEFETAGGTAAEDSHQDKDLANTGPAWTSTTGVVGNGVIVEAEGNVFQRADDPSFEPGAGSFTIAGWVYLTGDFSVDLFSKDSETNELEFILQYDNSALPIMQLQVSTDGSTYTTNAGVGAAAIAEWVFVVAIRDADTGLMRVGNASALDSEVFYGADVEFSGTVHQGSGTVNAYSHLVSSPAPVMDQLGFWTRALCEAEIAYLFNSGAGRAYADLEAASSCAEVFLLTEDDERMMTEEGDELILE